MSSRAVPESVRYLGLVFGLAGLYFLAARFGLLLQLPGTNASPVWPPSGIGLAAVLLFGLRAWPGVAVGAFLANLLTLPPTPAGLTAALAIAVGNTLEQVVGFLVLRRLVPSLNPFDRPADVFRFLAATVAAGAVAATVGAASLWATGIVGGGLVARVWFTWWLGDAAGILVLTPAVVCWWRNPPPTLAAGRRLELAAVAAVTALTAELTFGGWFPVSVQYLVVIGPMWAAFRFGPRETALLPVLLSVMTVTHVWRWAAGPGPEPGLYVPFVSGAAGVNDSLLMLQLFVCAVGVTAVTLAAAVAERARAEGLLREGEVRFRTVFEQAAVGVALIDTATGRFARVNRRYCDLLGYTSAEMARTTFMALTHPDDLPPDLDRMRRLVAGEIADFTLEKRLIRKDGRVVWVNLTVSPTWRPGEPPESHIAVVEDVTARRATEEQLRELNATLERRVEERARALREQEQRFRAIFHAQFQFIGLMAPDGTLLEANRTALAAAGVAEADVIGRPFWDTAWWTHDPAQRARLRDAVCRAAGGERVRFEASHPAADGALIWVDFSLTPFHGEDGRVALLIPEGRDVTERKQTEAALRASEERFRVLFEQSSDAHLIFDEADGILDCNPAAVAMLRCRDKTEVLALHPAVLSPEFQPDGRRSLEKCVEMDAAARRNGYHRFDWLHRRIDGESFPCEVTLTPVVVGGRSVLLVVWHDLTERARAEAALRASEERFRAAFDAAPIGMALVAPDGKWLRVNRSLCGIVGYAEGELLATDIQAITHPDDLSADLDLVRQMLAGGRTTYQMEKRYFHRDGHVVYVLLSVALVRDGAGRPLYFVSQLKDITQRKEAELALAARDALLRQFIHHSPAAVAMFDRELRYLQASARWLTDYHLDGQSVIGRSHYDVFPDVPERWKAIHRRVLEGAVERCEEDPFERADGSTEWLQWECQPWRDAAGAVGGIIMFTQVITERRRAEAALRASDQRYRMVLDGAGLGTWDWEVPTGRVTFDARLTEMLGYRLDEFRTDVREWSDRIHPDDRGWVMAEVNAHLDGRTPSYATEHRLRHKNGQWLWVLDAGAVFERDATGRAVRMCGIHMDVTNRKEAEERAQATLREKEVMLKEIHHRVKNNLQIVSALLDLQSGHTADAGVREMFKESRGRVKSMALIHERLYRSLDMARVNFADYARQLADDLYRTYKVSDDDIRLEVDVDLPPVAIDIAIPCGLLLNELISNCFKHAFPDRDAGCVRVSLLRAGAGAAELAVADDGVGFPADTDFRDTPSFGMQLVNTLVEQLEGTIELRTGGGTTFTVRFPITA